MSETQENFTIETAGKPTIEATQEIVVENTIEKKEFSEKPKEEVAPQKKGRAQKRIEGLSHDKRELSKENAELKERIEAMESKNIDLPKKPDIDSFDDYDEFDKEMKTYKEEVKKIDDARQEKEPPTNIDYDFQSTLEEIESKFDETREIYDDFDEVVKKTEGVVITKEMVETMNEIDNSGEVAYALGKDAEESQRIAKLSPKKQAIAIMKLGMKLEAKGLEPKKEKKQTKATEPIIPTSGGGGSRERGLNDADGFKDYASMRTEQAADKAGW